VIAAAIALWLATELSGAVLVLGFFKRGGMGDTSLDSVYPAALFANFSLGSATIVPLACAQITGLRSLAVAAFVQFAAVVAIGTVLALPWHRARRAGHPTPRGGGRPAFFYPGVVEAAHGGFAWLTAAAAGIAAFRG